MWPNPHLVTFTDEILNEKLIFFVQCELLKGTLWAQLVKFQFFSPHLVGLKIVTIYVI